MIRDLDQRFGPFRESVRIAADASTRTFHRVLFEDGRSAVIMTDSAGTTAAFDRLLAAHALLEEIGAPVPAILDRDAALSSIVFEDGGDTLLAGALSGLDGERRVAIYEEASRIAASIARDGTPKVDARHVLASRPLARERLRIELAFFATHDVAGRRGVTDRDVLLELSRVLDRIASELDASPRELAHRDFHARNLLLREDGRLVVVDFQDALLAPLHYDLASLLVDPYVTLDDAVREGAAAAYAEARGSAISPLEDPRFLWAALQRLLKAIGTYAFQANVRGNARFLDAIAPAERRALAVAAEIPDSFSNEMVTVLEKIGFAAA